LRINPRILNALRRWADDDLRSVNAQLEFILREAVRNAGRLGDEPDDESVSASKD
jgi:hypothetical protein